MAAPRRPPIRFKAAAADRSGRARRVVAPFASHPSLVRKGGRSCAMRSAGAPAQNGGGDLAGIRTVPACGRTGGGTYPASVTKRYWIAAMPRLISRIDTTPAPEPGFIGEGHTAVEVVRPTALAASDPFVLLMDDRLDIPVRRTIGGAHPHAGLETVTLILEGGLFDRDEGPMEAGDVVWMTAGRDHPQRSRRGGGAN